MNKRLFVLIWAGAWIVISIALFALFGKDDEQLALLFDEAARQLAWLFGMDAGQLALLFGEAAQQLALLFGEAAGQLALLFGEAAGQLALLIISSLVALVPLVAYILFIYVLRYLVKKVAAWMERHLGIILTLVAVVLVLSYLDESDSSITFSLVALMLGLIWWMWTIKKEQDKAARTTASQILNDPNEAWQQMLSNLPKLGPNAQQRIKKAIREELQQRPLDKTASMFLDGSPKMQEFIDEMLPQMPIKIRWDIKRAIKEERHRREARKRLPEEQKSRRRERQEIDQLFEGNIKQNTNEIVRRFFSGEFQDREYVIKKIRETSAEVQPRLEQAIGRKQKTLLKNPQTFMPGNAFVYLIRQEDFANEQFSFKIGSSKNLGKRLQQFQTGNSHLLHLWAVMSFPNTADAEEKEKKLHEDCQAWQETGEWFQGHALEGLLRDERFTPYFDLPQGPLIWSRGNVRAILRAILRGFKPSNAP